MQPPWALPRGDLKLALDVGGRERQEDTGAPGGAAAGSSPAGLSWATTGQGALRSRPPDLGGSWPRLWRRVPAQLASSQAGGGCFHPSARDLGTHSSTGVGQADSLLVGCLPPGRRGTPFCSPGPSLHATLSDNRTPGHVSAYLTMGKQGQSIPGHPWGSWLLC